MTVATTYDQIREARVNQGFIAFHWSVIWAQASQWPMLTALYQNQNRTRTIDNIATCNNINKYQQIVNTIIIGYKLYYL